MSKSIWILWIHEELKNGKMVRIEDLNAKLKVLHKTIRRDIDELRSYNAERACLGKNYEAIVYDKYSKSYRICEKGRDQDEESGIIT